MAEARGTVSGVNNKHKVMFYGLSTCVWCRRTRRFLEESGVAFDFVYLDLIEGEEREQVKSEVRQWNPSVSFPTLVINDSQAVIGFRTEQIAEALGL
jgi:glutaredoxin-like protein NrdH